MITRRGPGARSVPPQAGRTRRDEARGQAVDLGAIRRTDAIVDLLASRRLSWPRALGDPAITLLSSLSVDVDAPSGTPRDISGQPRAARTDGAPGAGPLSSLRPRVPGHGALSPGVLSPSMLSPGAMSSGVMSPGVLDARGLAHGAGGRGGVVTVAHSPHLAGPAGGAARGTAAGYEPERAGAAVPGAHRYPGPHRGWNAPWVRTAAAIVIFAAAAVTAAGLMMAGMLMRVSGTGNWGAPRR